MAKFFLIGEVGDDGAWLVDVEDRSVKRIEQEALARIQPPDSGSIGDLNQARMNGNGSFFQGVDFVVASQSRTGPSSHSRIEAASEGVNLAVASQTRTGPSSHSRIEAASEGVNLAVASQSRTGPSSHSRIEAAFEDVNLAVALQSRTAPSSHNRIEAAH